MHADGRNVDGAPENFQGWRHQDTADFNSKQVFPFKGIPLESNTLSQSSLPHLHALYQESFRDYPHRHPRGHPPGHPEVVYVFKPDPLEEPLEHGKDGEKKKKISRRQFGRVEKQLQHGRVPLGQELSDARGRYDFL